jgi:hypothetical protein
MNDYRQILENFTTFTEKLSSSEIRRRKNRKLFGTDPTTDYKDEELDALGRGIIRAQQDPDELEENECAGNPYRNEDGEFSSSKSKGSFTYPKKAKCNRISGQYRRAAGQAGAGKSELECGRTPRADGKRYKCKDGSLKEAEIDLDPEIDAAYLKAVVEKSVNQAVRAAMASVQKQTGCSLQQCLRIVNQLNQAEDGDLGKKKKKKN